MLSTQSSVQGRPRGRGWRWGSILALAWLVAILAAAAGASLLPIPSPYDMDFMASGTGPDGAHWLGTDLDGRDMFSRIIHGAQVSMSVAIVAPLIGGTFGTALGLIAAYGQGMVQKVVVVIMDTLLAFPALIFALVLALLLGPTLTNVALALGFMSIPTFARIARACALPIVNRDFVLAARAAGATQTHILLREILPNMAMMMLGYALTIMSVIIVAEGALSFIGVSVPPPRPTWGTLIAEGSSMLETAPHISMFPSLFMFLTVLSMNVLGDAIRRGSETRQGAQL